GALTEAPSLTLRALSYKSRFSAQVFRIAAFSSRTELTARQPSGLPDRTYPVIARTVRRPPCAERSSASETAPPIGDRGPCAHVRQSFFSRHQLFPKRLEHSAAVAGCSFHLEPADQTTPTRSVSAGKSFPR